MIKTIYGIDARPVIKQLVLTGIIILIVGAVGYKLLAGYYARASIIVLSVAVVFAAINISFAIFMLWRSLFGKLILRDRMIDLLNLKCDQIVLDVECGRSLLLIGADKKLNKMVKHMTSIYGDLKIYLTIKNCIHVRMQKWKVSLIEWS